MYHDLYIYNLYDWAICQTFLGLASWANHSVPFPQLQLATANASKLLDSQRGMALAGHLCSVPTMDPQVAAPSCSTDPQLTGVLEQPHSFQKLHGQTLGRCLFQGWSTSGSMIWSFRSMMIRGNNLHMSAMTLCSKNLIMLRLRPLLNPCLFKFSLLNCQSYKYHPGTGCYLRK